MKQIQLGFLVIDVSLWANNVSVSFPPFLSDAFSSLYYQSMAQDYLKTVVPSQLVADRGSNIVVINPGNC